jgi:hypothetical protein
MLVPLDDMVEAQPRAHDYLVRVDQITENGLIGAWGFLRDTLLAGKCRSTQPRSSAYELTQEGAEFIKQLLGPYPDATIKIRLIRLGHVK